MVERIAIEFPKRVHFSTSIAVRIGDVNFANHLSHDRLISMLHEARSQWLLEMGQPEYQQDGVGIVLADLAIQYLQEIFYGDCLQVDIAVANVGRKGLQLVYRASRLRLQDSEQVFDVVALAQTGVVFFDYQNRQAVAVPEVVRNWLDQPDRL